MQASGSLKVPTLYVPIEIKNRELESQLYLAVQAIRRGWRVYLGSQRAINLLIQSKNSVGGIFLDKGGLNSYWLEFKLKCDSIVVLDQELSPALTTHDQLERMVRVRFLPGNEAIADRFFVAGPMVAAVHRSFLQNDGWKVKDFGWPRVQLWQESVLTPSSVKSQNLAKKHGDFLLFSSDFGIISNKKIIASLKLLSNSDTPAYEKLYFDTDHEILLLETFLNIVELFKHWDNDPNVPKIIVRPHPSEDIAVWERALKGMKKTLVIHEGPISPWLDASKGLLHRGCTTAIEASIKNKATYFVEVPNDPNIGSKMHQISKRIVSLTNPPSIESNLNSNFNGTKERHDLLATIITSGSNLNPTDSILEELAQLMINPEPRIRRIDLLIHRLKLRNLRHSIGRVKWEAQWRLGFTPYEPPSQLLPKGIRRNDLSTFINLYSPDSDIEVVRVMKNLWEISLSNSKS